MHRLGEKKAEFLKEKLLTSLYSLFSELCSREENKTGLNDDKRNTEDFKQRFIKSCSGTRSDTMLSSSLFIYLFIKLISLKRKMKERNIHHVLWILCKIFSIKSFNMQPFSNFCRSYNRPTNVNHIFFLNSIFSHDWRLLVDCWPLKVLF